MRTTHLFIFFKNKSKNKTIEHKSQKKGSVNERIGRIEHVLYLRWSRYLLLDNTSRYQSHSYHVIDGIDYLVLCSLQLYLISNIIERMRIAWNLVTRAIYAEIKN